MDQRLASAFVWRFDDDKNGSAVMKKTDPIDPAILVLSDKSGDAALIKSLLNDEFNRVVMCTVADQFAEEYDRRPAEVVILAFDSLEDSENHCLELKKISKHIPTSPHRTVVLCRKDEVKRAYELCCQRVFDDYVLFWPMTYDSPRLLMAIHMAVRELAAFQSDGSGAKAVVAQAQALASVERGGVNSAIEPVPALATMAERALPTVLVVDDDSVQRKILGAILTTENCRVLYASSGLEALNSVCKVRPDLILMDVLMPDMSGLETTRRLKSSLQFNAIPVIMITGKSEGNIVVDSLRAGAMDFIVKPYDRTSLVAKINRVLRPANTSN
jgi:PleD family two-component response regulator